MINPLIFRAYDIRGIADPDDPTQTPDLTEETVYLIGKATATYLRQKYNSKHMAVGADVRLTSPKLKEAFIKGITECGIKTTDIGLAPSPMVYFATCSPEFDFDCGTNITASHNPKPYNGIKTVANLPGEPNTAHSVCGDELQEVLKIIQEKTFTPTPEPTTRETLDIWPIYKKELLKQVPNLARPLKVVVDAGNGVAGPYIPELLEAAGATVIPLYCEPDGTFPNHEANPEELHNMQDLIAEVRENKADLGIGFDGDSDRIGVIDEKGHHYSADYLLLLLTRDLIDRTKQNPGQEKPKVITDVKFSQAIINLIADLGAEPIMCKVGHSFIEKKVAEEKAALGGEVSGHMYFAENYYGFDDALLGALKILQVLAKQDKPFSKLFDDLPKTYMTPEYKAYCPDDKKFEIVKNLVDHFTPLHDCITLDGVRIHFSETDWGAVRASNTSPNLTLRFEATTSEKLAEIKRVMYEEVKKYPEVGLDWFEE
jgi:phosphomannomutase / phosphoglucomutase